MTDLIVAIFVMAGSLFMLVAALGIVKLSDVYMRMHAITKASSLSIILFIVAMIIYLPGIDTVTGGVAIILFIIATAPVASHMIARVSQMLDIPMSKGEVMNEMDSRDSGE